MDGRPSRRARAAALPLALGLLLGACGADSGDSPTEPTEAPRASGTTIVGVSPDGAPAADQTPPTGTNGIQIVDGRLWIADLAGGQLLVADAATGTILARFGPEAGLSTGPDDLVVAGDGTVYWTGFATGVLGHLTLDGRSRDLLTLEPGINPIAWSPTRTLYVGIAVTGDGLYEVDPAATPPTSRSVADEVGNVNAFAVGPDGAIYGPSYANGTGSVVRIDPATGETRLVADGLTYPVAVRIRPGGSSLLVLSNLPASLAEVALPTAEQVAAQTDPAEPMTEVHPLGNLPIPASDNLAIAPDGTVYVTTFSTPEVLVIAPDGTSHAITIGSAN